MKMEIEQGNHLIRGNCSSSSSTSSSNCSGSGARSYSSEMNKKTRKKSSKGMKKEKKVKIMKVEPSEFRSLVQRLTGMPASACNRKEEQQSSISHTSPPLLRPQPKRALPITLNLYANQYSPFAPPSAQHHWNEHTFTDKRICLRDLESFLELASPTPRFVDGLATL